MSKQTSTFTLEDSCPNKEETNKRLDHSILIGLIKEETYQNIDDNNQSYRIEDSTVIIKSNYITPESFGIDAVDVPEIETEKDNRNTLIKNSIPFMGEEIYIKEQVLTNMNNDTENVTVNNNKSNSITIDNSNVCMDIKKENDDNVTSCHNENLFIKTEKMSPKCSDIFTENIFEIKTENYNKNADVQSSILIKDEIDIEEDDYLVKEESYIEEDIPQYLDSHKREFKNHINIHTAENSYKCNTCLKSFTLKEGIKRHVLTHTGNKLHKCNICFKSFSRKDNLKTHLLTHTWKNPYKCNTVEKPFKCDTCLKTFTMKETLKKHTRIYTGEKQFEKICKYFGDNIICVFQL